MNGWFAALPVSAVACENVQWVIREEAPVGVLEG